MLAKFNFQYNTGELEPENEGIFLLSFLTLVSLF